MLTHAFIDTIIVKSWGSVAAEALRAASSAHAMTVFQHSCYLQTNQGAWVCLLTDGQPAGPLNMLCQLPENFDWRQHIRINSAIQVLAKGLETEQGYYFTTEQAEIWQAHLFHPPDPDALTDGLTQLARSLVDANANTLPGLGVISAWLLNGALYEPLDEFAPLELKHAWPGVVDLYDWLRQGAPDHWQLPASVIRLLGLGPGLTPSGDDLLAGLLIALHALGQDSAAKHLAAGLLRFAPARTHPVSLAHLCCAATGQGSEPLHRLLNALCSGGLGLPAALAELADLGYSSGWDALAGVTLASVAYNRQFLDNLSI